jgi:uncharacterized protein YjbI with pentapeptide repeats
MITRDDLMNGLLAAPAAILDHERALLEAQQALSAARDHLADLEAQYTVGTRLDGEPYLPGRIEAQRSAQLRDLTVAERAAVRHAEDVAAAARLQLTHRREERYMAPAIDRLTARRLLAARDCSGRDLRGIAAAGRDLAGLEARGARLRDADFRGADLQRARFDDANLSNARLQGADLRDASFAGADVEGADFRAADLRGADFRGASLFGATFAPDEGAGASFGPARIDRTTRIDREALEALTPLQETFVREQLA